MSRTQPLVATWTHTETVCGKCGRPYWRPVNTPRPWLCEHCGGTGKLIDSPRSAAPDDHLVNPRLPPTPTSTQPNESSSSVLPADLEQQLTSHVLRSRGVLLDDIRQLLAKALAPIQDRDRTWSEWLAGVDITTRQLEEKHRDCAAVHKLVRQRKVLVDDLRSMIGSMAQLQHSELERQAKLLEARLRLERLETELLREQRERLDVNYEIAQREALAAERIKTQQLEETRKHLRLMADIDLPTPPPSPFSQPPPDPLKEAVETQRRRLDAKVDGEQILFSDFLRRAEEFFSATDEDSVKVARLRVLLDVYKRETDALPKNIREFLERVEAQEVRDA